jgi:aldose 1-epimerase
MSAMTPLSGEQHVVEHGDQRAVITEVGATLRSYEVAGAPICWGFAEEEMASGGRGQVLAPWPNRLRDGHYEFEGLASRAALDEPERSNAIHGLVRWVPWRLVEHSSSAVRLGYMLQPQPAYPYRLALEVDYSLGAEGLTVSLRATAGEWRAPFGAGFHSYLAAGPEHADGARLALPVRERLLLDERALPVGLESVAGTPYEVAAGATSLDGRQPLGDLRLDDCFTGVVASEDGRWRVELLPGGHERPVVLWADEVYRYIMCFTGDTLAVEPMTCPPNAFQTGDDVIVIDPGTTFEASWGITPPGLAP